MRSPGQVARIFDDFGSDKCNAHNYQHVYHLIINDIVENAEGGHVLEIGYLAGASAMAWRALFPTYRHHSIDLAFPANVPDWLDCITCDTADAARVREVASLLPSASFALVVDDGSHDPDHQASCREAFWPLVAPGGYYVIEDIQDPASAGRYAGVPGYMLVDTRLVGGRPDDLMVVMRKPFTLGES